MPVVAVVNRKGGSGKSTLATHLAAYCSTNGMSVMLGDVDKQQSTQSWLKRRELQELPGHPPIVGWNVDPKNVVRPPAGIAHVVLDTPGGLRGFDLARVVMYADAIVMPICNSLFDRESAAECVAELMTLPRIASGRCRIAAIGMRLDARTKASEVLKEWARANKVSFIGVLRETQTYVRCIELGLSLFDMPPAKFDADLAQWKPILRWLGPLVQPVVAPVVQNTKMGAVTRLGPVTESVPPQAGQVRPVIRPAGSEPARGMVAPAEVIPAYLQVNGTSTVLDTPAPGAVPLQPAVATSESVRETVPFAAMRPATLAATPPRTLPVDSARPATLAATSSRNMLVDSARPATLAASRPRTMPIDSVRPATLATSAPRTIPAEPIRRPQPPVNGTPVSPAVARPQPPQRVPPRPAVTATRPKTIASRLGSLIDSIPIPRFLQRDS